MRDYFNTNFPLQNNRWIRMEILSYIFSFKNIRIKYKYTCLTHNPVLLLTLYEYKLINMNNYIRLKISSIMNIFKEGYNIESSYVFHLEYTIIIILHQLSTFLYVNHITITHLYTISNRSIFSATTHISTRCYRIN